MISRCKKNETLCVFSCIFWFNALVISQVMKLNDVNKSWKQFFC